uniref:Anticodon_1 domain-containing protein n=1 Tax=Caenorhabditis japonica TaxID=281687 RepID=A0A8R1HJE4_CAEJA
MMFYWLSQLFQISSSQSLRHIRLLNSFFVRSSTDENGDIGDVTSYNPGKLSFQQLIAAAQVFSSKHERPLNGHEEEQDLTSGVALIMLSHGADTHRLEVSSIISTLFTHCLLLQLIASLLISEENPKLKAALIGSASPISVKLDESIYPTIYGILNESSETATDFDNRPAVGSLLSRMLGIEHANLLKILVSSNLIKSMNLLRRFEETKATNLLEEVTKSVKARCIDLKSVELEKYVRDRLYCDRVGSESHLSAQFTLHRLAHNLAHIMSPILPHLSSEILQHLPGTHEKQILRQKFSNLTSGITEHNISELAEHMKLIQEIRNQLEAAAGPKIDTSKKVIVFS